MGKVNAPSKSWVIIDVDGGLVQDVARSDEGIAIVVLDFDNMRWKTQGDPACALEYYRNALNLLRTSVEPGSVRASWRLSMMEAVDWARDAGTW